MVVICTHLVVLCTLRVSLYIRVSPGGEITLDILLLVVVGFECLDVDSAMRVCGLGGSDEFVATVAISAYLPALYTLPFQVSPTIRLLSLHFETGSFPCSIGFLHRWLPPPTTSYLDNIQNCNRN